MQYAGEVISLVVAVSWTATALFADIASHRMGTSAGRHIRMADAWREDVVAFMDRHACDFVRHSHVDTCTWWGREPEAFPQTAFERSPVLIILPYSLIYKQRVSFKEVVGTFVTIAGVAMFFLLP